MRVAFVEFPDALRPDADVCAAADPHLLVLNELPFGDWVAESPDYDPAAACASASLCHVDELD